jgi:hypothetical protein
MGSASAVRNVDAAHMAGGAMDQAHPIRRPWPGLLQSRRTLLKSVKGEVLRRLEIRARTSEDADCLVRELAVYSPVRLSRLIVVELDETSQTDLLTLLAAVETCLTANDIRTVRIELDGHTYTMAAPQVNR